MSDLGLSYKKTMRTEGACNFNPHDKGNIVIAGVCTVPTYSGVAPVYHGNWKGFCYVKDIMASMKNRPPYGTDAFSAWKKQLDKSLAASPVVQNLVQSFYKVNFWDANRIGEIVSQECADWIFDHAVNAGARGIKWAQLAAKVTPDGGMGPVTVAAVNAMDPKQFLSRAADIAGQYRLDVAQADPTQIDYLVSWLTRDGQTAEIIAMVKAAARDGRIDEKEESQLDAAMNATA